MKHLIVCCDGTWNTPAQEDNGVAAPTNVVRLRNCLASAKTADAAAPVQQRSYYHTGVGTEGGRFARFLGGALGRGLNRNIQSAYHWLAINYQNGDAIYLFGYSRGAYTVRSLAGLIGKCGLPDLGELSTGHGWERIAIAFEERLRHGGQCALLSQGPNEESAGFSGPVPPNRCGRGR